MESIKFSNGDSFEITTNGVRSNDEKVRIALLAPDMDLVAIEEMISSKSNVNRLELLSEEGEVLRIYTGYTVLTAIEKKKDILIDTDIQDGEEVLITSDVIYITLRKENDTEARLTSLEETVDVLILSALE